MEEVVARIMAERKARDFVGILAGLAPSESVRGPMTPDVVFGASDFYDMCPVEEVLCSVHGIVRVEKGTIENRFLRTKGAAFHRMLQDDFFGRPVRETRRWQGGTLSFDVEYLDPHPTFLGWWRCPTDGCPHRAPSNPIRGEGGDFRSWIPMPDACPVCGSKILLYREPVHERDGFRTHSDGGLLVGSLFHLELKTSGWWKFNGTSKWDGTRDKPDEAHVVQCILNMHTTGLRRSLLVYWNRVTDNMKEAFATHVVEYDEGVIRGARAKAEATREGIKTGVIPTGFAKCDGPSCPRARSCAAKAHCPVVARA
jgi:hypothetical protein